MCVLVCMIINFGFVCVCALVCSFACGVEYHHTAFFKLTSNVFAFPGMQSETNWITSVTLRPTWACWREWTCSLTTLEITSKHIGSMLIWILRTQKHTWTYNLHVGAHYTRARKLINTSASIRAKARTRVKYARWRVTKSVWRWRKGKVQL